MITTKQCFMVRHECSKDRRFDKDKGYSACPFEDKSCIKHSCPGGYNTCDSDVQKSKNKLCSKETVKCKDPICWNCNLYQLVAKCETVRNHLETRIDDILCGIQNNNSVIDPLVVEYIEKTRRGFKMPRRPGNGIDDTWWCRWLVVKRKSDITNRDSKAYVLSLRSENHLYFYNLKYLKKMYRQNDPLLNDTLPFILDNNSVRKDNIPFYHDIPHTLENIGDVIFVEEPSYENIVSSVQNKYSCLNKITEDHLFDVSNNVYTLNKNGIDTCEKIANKFVNWLLNLEVLVP